MYFLFMSIYIFHICLKNTIVTDLEMFAALNSSIYIFYLSHELKSK